MKGRVVFSLVAMLLVALLVSGCAPAAAPTPTPPKPAPPPTPAAPPPTPVPKVDYPTKPIQLMVAYPAGGGTDVGARLLAVPLEKILGQPVVVVNKAGAGGQVGWTELAKQKPDGYYIGFVNLPITNAVALDPERKAAFTMDDFAPIFNQVLDPGVIWVRAESPYKTLKDLVDDAKKRAGKIKATTTGILSDDHFAIMMLEQAAGIEFAIVHFEGGAPAMTATLGGHVDVNFDNVGSIAGRMKEGDIRALAVMDKKRSKFLPDVPTTVELGYPTVISSSTRGIVGVKGTPQPIIKKLEEAIKKAMDDPEHVKKMEAAGLELRPMGSEEYGKYMKELHEKAKALMPLAEKRR